MSRLEWLLVLSLLLGVHGYAFRAVHMEAVRTVNLSTELSDYTIVQSLKVLKRTIDARCP